jgi:FixJ family two-component response regulator
LPETLLISIVDDGKSVRTSLKLTKSAGFKAETFSSQEGLLALEDLHHTACRVIDVKPGACCPNVGKLACSNPTQLAPDVKNHTPI